MIGGRRWDRNPRGRWQESAQSPLTEPTPPWGTAPAQAWLLGRARVGGRPVWVVAFADPGASAWVRLWIDKANLRPLELSLTAAAHFMHHRYSDFNRAAPIEPPARR